MIPRAPWLLLALLLACDGGERVEACTDEPDTQIQTIDLRSDQALALLFNADETRADWMCMTICESQAEGEVVGCDLVSPLTSALVRVDCEVAVGDGC